MCLRLEGGKWLCLFNFNIIWGRGGLISLLLLSGWGVYYIGLGWRGRLGYVYGRGMEE